MASEIHLAFAHPSERADATASEPLDRISVRDHIIEVDIGAFQAERGVSQRICFNVVVEVRPLTGPIDDDVDRILSYDKVTEAIAEELSLERLNLLETLAERVADRILLEPQAVRAFVRIEKLDRGPGALGVEIVRARTPQVVAPQTEAPVPEVVFLGNSAMASPDFSKWLDTRVALGPVILCVGPHDEAVPTATHPLATRRIALLEIEQNAWILAARDPRCTVVDTRTEIDWAMRNDQVCVWAPSKIVLDAVDGPPAQETDPLSLSVWFAELCGATGITAIGAEPSARTDVNVTVFPDISAALRA